MKLSKSVFKVAWGLGILTLFLSGCGEKNQKRVYFGNLEDGTHVESPFRVEMKAENLIVEPATMGVTDGHGHFHILVDAPLPATGQPIPKDAQHIHYGQGDKETVLDLPVGRHTLILQFATGDHLPYNPQIFQQVGITVTKQNPKPAVDTAAKADRAKLDSAVPADTPLPGSTKPGDTVPSAP
ncbi:MAG TPA: DUF4399 domain-containing protein [Fibrobacteria bacterium]|nr:DUF4399 domain-containing protein [Fibrobacteria bacterium]